MANKQTKQAKEYLLTLFKGQEPLPLETVYAQCNCDLDTLAGALSSLIEKEEVGIGRYKTKSGWLIGENGSPGGGVLWYSERVQLRKILPKILKEIRKYAPSQEMALDDVEADKQLPVVLELLSDGQPRNRAEIIAATGVEDIHSMVWRRLPQLPDGRFTLPDSRGAWAYLFTYLRERPRRLSDLLRLFRRHGKITAALAAKTDTESFVWLPRSFVTTVDSPEGKKELEQRRQIKLWRDMLDSLSHPFFMPGEFDLDPEIFYGLSDKYTVATVFGRKKYYSLRREFPGEVLVEQLGEISGRYFAPPHTAAAPFFLSEQSLGEKDAANVLGLDEETLSHLMNTGIIGHFILDGRVRLWRSDVEALRRDTKRLTDLTKGHQKLTVPEAAAFLGISTAQVRGLVEEGKLNPVSLSNKPKQGSIFLIKRADLEEVRGTLPTNMSPRLPAAGREQRSAKATGEVRPTPKKRPPRREELPPPETDQLLLDDFQIQAAGALREGLSVLVSAPTGNGKTLVAEMLAKDLMAANRGMVYTSPLKALSNQKYRDFRELFGEEAVGLVTGDVSINPGAPMLIMTTEIFRNWCLSEPEQLEKTAYVVFDEIHFLDDAERGTTWEESILFAPSHVKILGLSATVPNVEEMAHWIGEVRKENVVIIRENKRHVPLSIRWILPNGRIVKEAEARNEVQDLTEYLKALRNKRRWIEE